MRLDPAHVRKLARALTTSPQGNAEASFDIAFMTQAFDRLSLWERGLLMQALLRSAGARRRTLEQRALLALFVEGGDDQS